MTTTHHSRVTSHRRSVPWSAHAEKSLRLVVWFDRYAILTLTVVAIGFLIWKAWLSVLACCFGALFYSIDIQIQRRKLDAMMLNKPRGTARLTEYVKLRPWQTEISCACGAVVQMARAKWFPNPVDPGGGRFSIVCPCGIGYYKLREEKAVTRDS